jgi:membrane-associated protein
MRNRRTVRGAVLAVGLLAVVLLVVGVVEGDVAEDLTHLGGLVIGLLNRFGAAACLVLLYMEESGVPLPVPGDFYVAFMGKLFAGSLTNLTLACLGTIAVVVAGSTNLYWISRRWGPQLIRHPVVAGILAVDERRLARAHRWFERWGALAIIFGRHLPGFRIPITVIAATLGVPYPVFALSVAVSSAIWAAAGLWVGATLGASIGNLLARDPWIYLAALGLIILALAYTLVRQWTGWGSRRAMQR